MILLLIMLLVGEPQLPQGISCHDVRQLVAEHGYFPSIVWARAHGFSWRQIAEAKKCLRAASLPSQSVRDDGRYAGSALKEWFDGLRSGRGPCCSDADGSVVKDADWESRDGHYRVRLDGEWIDVPDDAVIEAPNLMGRTMVWPIRGYLGTSIRCFMPGPMG